MSLLIASMSFGEQALRADGVDAMPSLWADTLRGSNGRSRSRADDAAFDYFRPFRRQRASHYAADAEQAYDTNAYRY